MQSHIYKVCACLAVTCHLHFWQNDGGLLRATVVTQGWNRYWNKSWHRKLTLEKKILPPLLQGFKPMTFWPRVQHSNHWAIPAPWDKDAVVPCRILPKCTREHMKRHVCDGWEKCAHTTLYYDYYYWSLVYLLWLLLLVPSIWKYFLLSSRLTALMLHVILNEWLHPFLLFYSVFSPGQVNFQFSDGAAIPNVAYSQVADSGKTPKYWGLAVN